MIIDRLLAHNSREEAIPLKKTWFILLLIALSALILTGCASSADTQSTPTPGATENAGGMMPDSNTSTMGPDASMAPDASEAPAAGGISTLEEAQKASEAMEEAVSKLSEVDDAYVVAVGDTALVGVKFTPQYQSGADERMKKMVLARVQTVDKTVRRVAVTENQALVTGIRTLAETLEDASSLDDVNTKLEDMLKQVGVYTE